MNSTFSAEYLPYKNEIEAIIENFNTTGKVIYGGSRNTLKTIDLTNGQTLNIKAFKVPNLINQFAYRFVRASKAKRSFDYANKLTSLGIGTPTPVAYVEFYGGLGLQHSYYISCHEEPLYTYRDLVHDSDLPDYDKILRDFTAFSYELHEKEVEFLDHSPGNTLIFEAQGTYEFKLVDLNRMNFRALSFDDRMRNMRRLTPQKKMVEVMSDAYAKLSGHPFEDVFQKMWFYTEEFQTKFQRKRRLKKRLKFWKK